MPTLIRQLKSQTTYLVDGSTTVYNFNFTGGYLDKAHVKVSYLVRETGIVTQVPISTADFVGPYQLALPSIPLGTYLTIYRESPVSLPIVDFADSSNITEIALDTNAKQAIFVAAETRDQVDTQADAGESSVLALEAAKEAQSSALAAQAANKFQRSGGTLKLNSDKSLDWVSALDYGDADNGNGVKDDSLMLYKAIINNPGRCIILPDPAVSYNFFVEGFELPAGTVIMGVARKRTLLNKTFNGDMFKLNQDAGLQNFAIYGNGSGGRFAVIDGTAGGQHLKGLVARNFDGPIVEYSLNAGSQSMIDDCTFSRSSAGSGTGRYAIVMGAGFKDSAVPRTITGFQSDGTCGIFFGGCNDVFVDNCAMADLGWTDDSRGVCITGSRIFNQTLMQMAGHNHSITGCDILPQIRLLPGTDNCHINGNSHNAAVPFDDQSGNARNTMTHWTIAYTSALTTGGGGNPASLGNGTLTAYFCRTGGRTQATLELVVGTTTDLGTGPLTFALPHKRHNAYTTIAGRATVTLPNNTVYTATAIIAGASTTCTLVRDTSGSITFNSPVVLASGTRIRVELDYSN